MHGEPQRAAADGVLEIEEDRCVVRFERFLAHPVEDVWRALTEPRQLARWWGEAKVDLVRGGQFVMRWLNTDDEGSAAVMHGTITAIEPLRLLEISADIHGVLCFTLSPQAAGTRVRFSSTLKLPDEFRTKVLAGWHFHLDALATVLSGGATDLVGLSGFGRIHERYLWSAGETDPNLGDHGSAFSRRRHGGGERDLGGSARRAGGTAGAGEPTYGYQLRDQQSVYRRQRIR